MIRELATIVLREDLPKHHLVEGDVGTVVMVHKNCAGYEVEFVTFEGETVTVISLGPSQVRVIAAVEVPQPQEACRIVLEASF